MPFTPAHAAAILPLLRTPLPASALIAGTWAPDLPYYLPIDLGVSTPALTHTPLAVVTTDIMISALIWLLWHVLAAPALAAAPAGLRARLAGRFEPGVAGRLNSPRMVALTVLAFAVGAATHVLWDELSHAGRWGTQHIAALSSAWHGLAGYRWMQYGGGVLGIAVLLIWLALWWRRTPPAPTTPDRSGALLIWLALFVAGAVAGITAALTADSLRSGLFAGATHGGAAIVVVAVGFALIWHVTAQADHDAG